MASDDNVLAALSQLEFKTARSTTAKKDPKPLSPPASPTAPLVPPAPVAKSSPPPPDPKPSQPGAGAGSHSSTPPAQLPDKSPVTKTEEPSLAPPLPVSKPDPAPKREVAGTSIPSPLPVNPAAVTGAKDLWNTPKPPPFPKEEPAAKSPPSSLPASQPTSPGTAPSKVSPAATAAKAPPAPVGPAPVRPQGQPATTPAPVVPSAPPTTPPLKKLVTQEKAAPTSTPPTTGTTTSPISSPVSPALTSTSPSSPASGPPQSVPTARSLDLDLVPRKGKRFRKNSLVTQRADGEPSHRGFKTAAIAATICAVAAGGYLAFSNFIGSDKNPDDTAPPGIKPVPGSGTDIPQNPPVKSPDGSAKPPQEIKPPSPIDPGTASEIDNELAFLRSRNELTTLADEAISSGDREAYENILKRAEDPGNTRLADAAKAEALRVQQFYFQSNRPQNYKIPAKEIFRDPAIESERDLTTYQKIALLRDLRQDWKTRTKAAFVLAGSRDLDAADALVHAIQTDPDLNVVKEAHTTFEQNWGYRGDLFDVPPLVEWWKQNRPGSNPS